MVKREGTSRPSSSGASTTSGYNSFAQGVKSCGSNVTRQCVLSYAQSQTNWTAGGLHDPEKPGNANNDTSQCFTIIKATSAGFVLDPAVTKPNQGIYNCDPLNVFKLTNLPKS